MNLRRAQTTLAAALAAAFIAAAPSASAQTTWQAFPSATPTEQAQSSQPMGMPRITGFDVRNVERLEAGAELEFTVWGTPGAQATLRIDGARRPVMLSEVSPGVYQGSYTISRRDRLDPNAEVTANLRRGNQVGTAVLDEPLVHPYNAPTPTSAANAQPEIKRFSVSGGDRQGAQSGDTIRFDLSGTPGGRASVVVPSQTPGLQPRIIVLNEMRPGEYSGSYTLQYGERIDPNQNVTARLRYGDRTTNATVNSAFRSVNVAQRATSDTWCADCGTIEAINRIEVDGDGGYVGPIAGGVLGAVLGSQVGKGDGRTAAGVAGAVGGALIGREIERRRGRHEAYEVVVRMSNGNRQTVTYETMPSMRVGDQVRVVDGAIQPRSR